MRFTPRNATTLNPSTDYYLVGGRAPGSYDFINIAITPSEDVDAGAAAGWDIADGHTFSGDDGETYPTLLGSTLKIAVDGRARSGGGTNRAPTASDVSVTLTEDAGSFRFRGSHFGFSDADQCDTLQSLEIVSVPSKGSFRYIEDNGGDSLAVTAGTSLSWQNFYSEFLRLSFAAAAIDDYGSPYASFTFKVSDGKLESSSTYTMTINVTGVPDPATGSPSISGTALVGDTLTAGLGTVADVDGLPDTFTYQWIRVDGGTETDIASATSSTYTLTADDLGKQVKVKLGFTDAGGTDESLTSDAYPETGSIANPAVPGEFAIAGLADATVNENAPYASAAPSTPGAPIGTVTWTLEGADAGDFTISSSTGVVSMVARNFESPVDADTDNAYEVIVKATDTGSNSATTSFTVTVADVTEMATLAVTGLSNRSVEENTEFTSPPADADGHADRRRAVDAFRRRRCRLPDQYSDRPGGNGGARP